MEQSMSRIGRVRVSSSPTLEDRVLFKTHLVGVGAFRCDRHHPAFHDASAPTETFCFVFPRSAVLIEHEHERPFVANPAIMTFHNRGQYYRRAAVSRDGDRSDWFSVDQAVLMEVVETLAPGHSPDPGRPFRVSHAQTDAHTYSVQRQVFEQARRGSYAEPLVMEEMVLMILERLVRQIGLAHAPESSRSVPPRHRELVHEAEILLSRHFEEALSLAAVARYLETSEYHLCRVFRRVTGTTLHHYRHALRIRSSLERVADSPSTLTDIAVGLGFSSHSHFTQAFRREFGQQPSRFREMIRTDPLYGLLVSGYGTETDRTPLEMMKTRPEWLP
jgi:AraC family transcriptional regulator